MTWSVHVTAHASSRGLGRLGLYPGQVRAEVQAALAAGRLSPHAPAGFRNGRSGVLYAASADGRACYVLAAGADAFVVVSVLARQEAAAA